MSKTLSLFFVALLVAAAIIPALSIPLGPHFDLHAGAHPKRFVDVACTFGVNGQKPARCSSGQPLVNLPHLPGGVQPVALREVDDLAKRLLDYECTFAPEGQKPARCGSGQPSVPSPGLPLNFRPIVHRELDSSISKREDAILTARELIDHMKRIVDVECTFLPADQKPARCSQPPPATNSPFHFVSKVATRSTDNMRRLLDYQCTFLPENEKPARCSQPQPTGLKVAEF